MEFIYEVEEKGIKIEQCCGEEQRVEVPAQIEGRQVYALAAYAFSDARRTKQRVNAVSGHKLKEIRLPETLREIGGYAFYGCWKLERMELFHSTNDIAGGAFTGCHRLKELCIHMEDAWGYCLKDIISELRHELKVTLIYGGDEQAVLLFPEYYEEAVENTPARILETHFHGSGYRYRQCFQDGKFNYQEYDNLFYEALAWESEDFCIELALLRLKHPYGLQTDARGCYKSFLIENRMTAAGWCLEFEQNEALEYISSFIEWSGEELGELIQAANKKGRMEMQSFLMDYKHKKGKKTELIFEW